VQDEPMAPIFNYTAKTLPDELKAWSASAVAAAENLARSSKLGRKIRSTGDGGQRGAGTDLPEEDIRLGRSRRQQLSRKIEGDRLRPLSADDQLVR
jgi:hypothetical protein